MGKPLKIASWVAGSGIALLGLGVLLFYKEDRRMHREMDERTLVSISMAPLVQHFDTVDMVLCGQAHRFAREALLDTVVRNFPTGAIAAKCPVRFNCNAPKGEVVSYELDSIEFHATSGEHAFRIGAYGVEYRYWP